MANPRIQVGSLTYAVQPAVAQELRQLRAAALTLGIACACLSNPRQSIRKAIAQKATAVVAAIRGRPLTPEEQEFMQAW